MKDRVSMASVCLHISAVLYAILGFLALAALVIPEVRLEVEPVVSVALLILCFVLIVVIEVVAKGLRRRRYWAWVAGLCIFAIYLPSLFLPLGALGLWGLLSPGSRVSFGVVRTDAQLGAAADPGSP